MVVMEQNELGQLIGRRREELNYSLRELAAKTGISHSYLSNLERGYDHATGKPTNPSVDKLAAVAKGLRLPIEELLRAAGVSLGGTSASPPQHVQKAAAVIPSGKHPPTAEEQRILELAEDLGIYFSGFSEPGFWDRTPERRRRTFIHFEGLLLEEQEERRRGE